MLRRARSTLLRGIETVPAGENRFAVLQDKRHGSRFDRHLTGTRFVTTRSLMVLVRDGARRKIGDRDTSVWPV
jgi:hypothetical protein